MKKKFLFILIIVSFFISCKSKPVSSKLVNQAKLIINPKYDNKDNSNDNLIESLRVEVEGLAEITSSGRQVAYDQAIRHGLRKAVEKALGIYVDSRTRVENQTLIEDKIYARSYGFVEKYEILNSWVEDKVLYQRLTVWVVLSDIEDSVLALDLIQDRVGRPSLYFNITEENFSGSKTDFAEEIMSRYFLEKQFIIIEDKKTIPSQIEITGAVRANINDTSKNKYLQNSSLKSVSTSLNLTAYTTSDRKVVATFSEKSTQVNLNPNDAMVDGIKDLAKKSANLFIKKILNRWDKATNNGREYIVFVSEVEDLEVDRINEFIKKSVQGVRAVFNQGYENKTLTLLIRFTGSIDELAGYISSTRNPVSLRVERYQGKVLYLNKS